MTQSEKLNSDFDIFDLDKGLLEITKAVEESGIFKPKVNYDFVYQDFKRSGIKKETIDEYVEGGYLSGNEDKWKLFYPELTDNTRTDFYTVRLKNPKEGQGKYVKPPGQTTRLFRPLALPIDKIFDKNEYLIITEGDKKAIKAVQEGFNCISLSGTWNWKMKPITGDEDQNKSKDTEEELYADIIPDLKNIDFENKQILLCYDADLWEKPQVKQALYQFAAFLIREKGAIVKIILLPKDGPKGIDDFLIANGADEFQKLINNAKTVTLKDIQNELADKKKAIEFPLEIFPSNIKNLIIDMGKSYDAPIEYIACILLSVVGIIICGHYSISVKPSSNWVEHPITWFALIGNPSQKKTPCLQIGKDILDEFDRVLETQYEEKLREYNLKMADYKIAKKERDEKIKKNQPPGDFIQEPEKPLRPRFTVQNITVESMFEVIKANSDYSIGVAMYIDELASLFNSFNQYKKNGNDKQYYLQSWSRAKQNIVRKSSKTDYKVDVGHNIIGGIQPKVLYQLLFKNGIESYDGMIERWLFVLSEYLEKGFEYEDNSDSNLLDIENKNDFEKLCQNLYLKVFDNKDIQRKFTFNNEAQKLFIDFCNQVVKKKKSDKLDDLTKSYLQKQTNYVARFALILQCFYDSNNNVISVDIVKKAIKLSSFFISCFSAVLNEKLEANPLEDAAISYLKAKNLKSISPTKLFKSNENKYKTNEKARRTLENLAHKGYGRLIKAKNGAKFVFYGS